MDGRPRTLALLLGGVAALAGCGGDDRPPPEQGASGAAVAGPALGRDGFATATGGALQDVTDGVPLVLRATPREDRPTADRRHREVTFTLRDRAGTPLQEARTAVYVARPDGTGARGPFLARTRPVAAVPPGADDAGRLAAATSEYVARVPGRPGRQMLVTALCEVDGRVLAATPWTAPAS